MDKLVRGSLLSILSISLIFIFILLPLSYSQVGNIYIKEYDEPNKIVTIKNKITGSIIAEIQLINNTDKCTMNCHADIRLDLRQGSFKPLDDVVVYNIDNKGSLVSRSAGKSKVLLRQDSFTTTEDIINRTCTINVIGQNATGNITNGYNCVEEKIGTKQVQQWNYIQYNPTTLAKGEHYIRVEFTKGLFERVDWIPTFRFLGTDFVIDEWAVFGNALVGYWNFEEGSGTEVINRNNRSTYNFTTFVNTPKWITGKVGGFQMNFTTDDGDGNSVGDTDINASDLTEFSWTLWINSTKNESAEQVIFGHNDIGNARRQLRIIGAQGLRFSVGDGTSEININSGGKFDVNVSHFVVVTAKDDDLIRMFVDNDNVANGSFSGSTLPNTQPPFFLISQGAGSFFNGSIDEVGYWEVALNKTDVNELWNNGDGLPFPAIPNVTIEFPVNSSNHSTSSVDVNYTSVGEGLQDCWYSNDSGLTNNTITCGNNVTGEWDEGVNTVFIYANNTLNQVNDSEYVSFVVDTTRPNVTLNDPGATETSLTFDINFTAVDDSTELQTCTFNITVGASLEVAETTVANCHNSSATVSSGAPTNYVLHIKVNDTLGNQNITDFDFTVDTSGGGGGGAPGGGGGGGASPSATVELFDTNFTFKNNKLDFVLAKGSKRPRQKIISLINRDIEDIDVKIECQVSSGNFTRGINICDFVAFDREVLIVSANEQEEGQVVLSVSTPPNAEIGDKFNYEIIVREIEGKGRVAKLSVSNRVTFLAQFLKWSSRLFSIFGSDRAYPVFPISFVVALPIFPLTFFGIKGKRGEQIATAFFLGVILFILGFGLMLFIV